MAERGVGRQGDGLPGLARGAFGVVLVMQAEGEEPVAEGAVRIPLKSAPDQRLGQVVPSAGEHLGRRLEGVHAHLRDATASPFPRKLATRTQR